MLASHHPPEQILHHGDVLILPTTVVGMQVYFLLAQPVVCKDMVEPFPMSTASSIRSLICRGMATQHTPNIAHFRGVIKYIGPGWRGSLG